MRWLTVSESEVPARNELVSRIIIYKYTKYVSVTIVSVNFSSVIQTNITIDGMTHIITNKSTITKLLRELLVR